MPELIEMKFIRAYKNFRPGDVVRVNKATAGLLETLAVARRVRRPHARRKPITGDTGVTK
jgi:hypothetical protein